MRWTTAATFLFVIYCVEVGLFFLFAPWSLTWDRLVVSLPVSTLHDIYLNPIFRAAVSGFGLVHLLWAVHDVRGWLDRPALTGDPKSSAKEGS